MRRPFAGLGLLALMAATGTLAAQGPSRDERPIRSWSEEMRDKAEHSLYADGDCRGALRQANAAYDRASRHPTSMDPRIALVKARAHDCLAQFPAAVAAYQLYDALSGTPASDDPALGGACRSLTAPEGLPADPAARAALRVRLEEESEALERVLRRAAQQAGRAVGEPIGSPGRWRILAGAAPDGTQLSRNQVAALWPRYLATWRAAPGYDSRGYRTNEESRYTAADASMERELATVDAMLVCLEVTP
ncbi:MAG TPA: hypothetical protein PKA50_12755 [Gemmatimonadales bacterium]|nr:hypothetical protein [Gemmatimonadales bacterium]